MRTSNDNFLRPTQPRPLISLPLSPIYRHFPPLSSPIPNLLVPVGTFVASDGRDKEPDRNFSRKWDPMVRWATMRFLVDPRVPREDGSWYKFSVRLGTLHIAYFKNFTQIFVSFFFIRNGFFDQIYYTHTRMFYCKESWRNDHSTGRVGQQLESGRRQLG